MSNFNGGAGPFKFSQNNVEGKKVRNIIIGVVVIIALAVLGFSSVCTVPTGSTGLIITFGKTSNTVLPPGLHFKMPFVSNLVIINNQVQKNETAVSSSSRDLQVVTATIAVNYHIDNKSSVVIYKNVGAVYEKTVIDPAIQESFKASTAKHSAEELITMRQQVSDTAKEMLMEKLAPYGIVIDAFNITDLEFSNEFNAAIEAKQTAQQQALKAEQDLRRIEVEAKQKIVQAEADAEATKIQADAQAEANKKLAESLTSDLVEYQKVNKWDGKYPDVVAGDGSGILVDGRKPE